MLPKTADGVVFDCDATLSTLEGIDELAALAGVAAQVSALTHRAMNGEVPLEAVYGERLSLIRPKYEDVVALAERYLAHVVSGAQETIARLQAAGIKVAIVSGGLLPAILPLADALGVEAADTFAVSLRFDMNGDYLGVIDSPLTTAQGKAAIVAEWKKRYGLQYVVMIGDGMSDVAARASGAADAVIGYGGVVERASVRQVADLYSTASDLTALLPLLRLS
ncbi:MAG: HAD-IB family phosphatase [Cardiobacteriaceae bacterium]|nr:HAD-IB family phosphatase [Cardiobacteriaceae bacterium]